MLEHTVERKYRFSATKFILITSESIRESEMVERQTQTHTCRFNLVANMRINETFLECADVRLHPETENR